MANGVLSAGLSENGMTNNLVVAPMILRHEGAVVISVDRDCLRRGSTTAVRPQGATVRRRLVSSAGDTGCCRRPWRHQGASSDWALASIGVAKGKHAG